MHCAEQAEKVVRSLDALQLSEIAKKMYRDGPLVRRKLQHWRPYICPFERLIRHVPEGSQVLDIGCGGGLLLSLMAGLGMEFEGVGIDVSQPSIDMARAVAMSVAVRKLKARLSFQRIELDAHWPAGTFDVVFLVDVLHNIPLDAQREFIGRAIAKVREGGILVFKDMCSRPWWRMQANRMHDLLLARELVAHVPISRVEEWVGSMGMRVIVQEDIARLWYGHELRVFERSLGSENGVANS